MSDEGYICPQCGDILFGEKELREHWSNCINEPFLYMNFKEWKRQAKHEFLTYLKDARTKKVEFNREELMWIYNALCDYSNWHRKDLSKESVKSLMKLIHKIEKLRRLLKDESS